MDEEKTSIMRDVNKISHFLHLVNISANVIALSIAVLGLVSIITPQQTKTRALQFTKRMLHMSQQVRTSPTTYFLNFEKVLQNIWETKEVEFKKDQELILAFNDKLENLDITVHKFQKGLADVSSVSRKQEIYDELSELREDIHIMKKEYFELNKAILETPEKALAVPLLRNEIANLKEAYRNDMLQIKEDINRVYDINKWVIGLIGALVLAVVSFTINNFLQNKIQAQKTG